VLGSGPSRRVLAVAADREPREHVRRNRARWDVEAESYVAAAERGWARKEPVWGIWHVAESQLNVIPAFLRGKRVIELGCATAYVSSWLARRGAQVVGIDASMAQLATARRLQREHGLTFPLVHGDAEAVPCRDALFDLAISEYGACLWADPDRWIPEAARILKPGGELIFLVNSTLFTLCVPAEDDRPATDRLLRPEFGMFRIESRRSRSGVSHVARRLDPAAPSQWLRDRRSHRGATAGDGHDQLPLCHARVVAPLAGRGDLAGAAPVTMGPWTTC
jgi:SAM-dependent methyltransferase